MTTLKPVGMAALFNKGFTLIELLVVVLIIGILAAVALPQYKVAVMRARVAKALPLLRGIADAKGRYLMANGSYTADLDVLDIHVPYASREERSGTNWGYYGTPIGEINVATQNSGVFWGAMGDLTINFYTDTQTCYGWNKTGDRVCASYGPKISDTSSGGWPTYRINF